MFNLPSLGSLDFPTFCPGLNPEFCEVWWGLEFEGGIKSSAGCSVVLDCGSMILVMGWWVTSSWSSLWARCTTEKVREVSDEEKSEATGDDETGDDEAPLTDACLSRGG